jgi:hypothetical protein
LIDPLRDIHGIDPAPWWPLAAGWWLIMLGILLGSLLAWWLWRQRRLYPLGRWQKDARRRLQQLRKRLKSAPTKELAGELSELLRRIAIARCGRKKTASMTGKAWLAWLHNNDQSGFNWQEEGQLLLLLPYAPPNQESDRVAIGRLIEAALRWVSEDKCDVQG